MIQEVLQSHLAHLYNHQVTGGLRILWSRPSKDRSILSGLKHNCLNISFHLPPDLGDLIKSWAHLLLWPRRKEQRLTEVEFWWGIWGENPEATLADEWPEEPKLRDEGPVCDFRKGLLRSSSLFSKSRRWEETCCTFSCFRGGGPGKLPAWLTLQGLWAYRDNFLFPRLWGPAENNGLQWERHQNTKGRGE